MSTMSTPPVSPGGALLRASRVFSLPRPLRHPASARRSSPTATTVYPLHQAISTPRDSIRRGDWGFKRAFPLKSTTKSNQPLIAVKAIDNVEDVTDFMSAGGHNVTLKKWQEMNLPLTTSIGPEMKRMTAIDSDRRRSVFEDDIDHTVVKPDAPLGSEDMRWDFKGPYLPALNEGRFMSFFEDTVQGRGPEFREYVRRSCAQDLNKEARKEAEVKAAMLDQDVNEVEYPALISPEDVTEEQLTLFVRKLRGDRVTLNQHVRAFLDLPPAPTKRTTTPKLRNFHIDSKQADEQEAREEEEDNGFVPSNSPFAETGPPKTHPSAGLSYLRTANFIANHPVFGPRENKPPVEARIVMPQNARFQGGVPLIGVAGFIADIPKGQSFGSSNADRRQGRNKSLHAGLLNVEHERVGGSKAFVHPVHAHISPMGGVIMKVDPADEIAIAVKLERDDELVKDMADAETPSGVERSILLGRRKAPRDSFQLKGPGEPNARGSGGYGIESSAGVNRSLDLPQARQYDPVANQSEADWLSRLGDERK